MTIKEKRVLTDKQLISVERRLSEFIEERQESLEMQGKDLIDLMKLRDKVNTIPVGECPACYKRKILEEERDLFY